MLRYEASATDETDTSYLSMTNVEKDISEKQDCSKRRSTKLRFKKIISP
jgi:hypothetical protein